MLKKLGMSALGLVVVLAYWTFTGRHNSVPSVPTKMPTKYLSGGAGTLMIEADSSAPAVLRFSFHNDRVEGTAKNVVEGYENLDAGHYTWSTELAPKTGVDLELEARDPKPGAKLNWSLKLNGKEIDTQNESLEGALKANEAFFIQYIDDDITKPKDNE